MSKYQKGKARAYDMAFDWQVDFRNHDYSYGEFVYFQNLFERLGKRYGLLREFRENGIC